MFVYIMAAVLLAIVAFQRYYTVNWKEVLILLRPPFSDKTKPSRSFLAERVFFLIVVSYSGFVPSSIWMTAICPNMLTNASGTQKRSLNF